jgi:2'-5' RNA ligase
MRFFIALEIPRENLAEFQSIQDKLHTLIPRTKLTDLNKIHLTLAFIGEQPEKLKINLIKIITDAAREIPAFTVTPAYLDGFPEIHHLLILWVGVKGDIDKIHIIRERIKDGLKALRLPVDERRFIPHISVAKFSKPVSISNGLEVDFEKIMSAPFTPIQISSIKLFESTPENGIHTHNTLAEIKLI